MEKKYNGSISATYITLLYVVVQGASICCLLSYCFGFFWIFVFVFFSSRQGGTQYSVCTRLCLVSFASSKQSCHQKPNKVRIDIWQSASSSAKGHFHTRMVSAPNLHCKARKARTKSNVAKLHRHVGHLHSLVTKSQPHMVSLPYYTDYVFILYSLMSCYPKNWHI